MSNPLEDALGLRRLWSGFQSARIILTANNFEIFEHLKKPLKASALAKKLGTNLRATELLLDAVTAFALLKKSKGTYVNTLMANKYLVRGGAYYQGDILRHSEVMWHNWSHLDEVMKTGAPARKARNHEAFILGMDNMASLRAKEVIQAMNIQGVKTALDLGGGPGTYAVQMSKKGINVTLFDIPETMSIAKSIAEKRKAKKINFVGGDFLEDDIGRGYDLIFISQILHAYSPQDSLRLIKKCKKALNPGGRIVVQEFFLEESRTAPLPSAVFSINMLVGTTGGRCYSLIEIGGWLIKAGLKDIKAMRVADTVMLEGTR